MSPRKNDSDLSATRKAAMTKWIVFGVVIIVFMFLFRGQIEKILDRTEQISITKDGLEIKTVSTPLGQTVLSNEAAGINDESEQPVSQSYVDNDFGFEIDWPQNGSWTPDPATALTLSQTYGTTFPLYLAFHQSIDGFVPNINIIVGSTEGQSMIDWLENENATLVQAGWEIVSSQIDEQTQSGVRVISNKNMFGGLYQVQRFLFRGDFAYVVTASKLMNDNNTFPHLYNDMLYIINSFHLV
jgi:hypothetical protein